MSPNNEEVPPWKEVEMKMSEIDKYDPSTIEPEEVAHWEKIKEKMLILDKYDARITEAAQAVKWAGVGKKIAEFDKYDAGINWPQLIVLPCVSSTVVWIRKSKVVDVPC